MIDVGAHKGETIQEFLSNFKIKNIYSFEASPKTFTKLIIKLDEIKKKFNQTNIEIFNFGIGNTNNKNVFSVDFKAKFFIRTYFILTKIFFK